MSTINSIKSDSAFERRFEPLTLEEPTESEAIEIVSSAIPSYEQHHGVRIFPEAAESAVKLSMQHILDRRLPDKALDLLDSACTFIRIPDSDLSESTSEPLVVNFGNHCQGVS